MQRHVFSRRRTATLVACAMPTVFGILTSAVHADNTWTGTGDWNTPENWSGGIPAAGQDVVIASGSVTLTTPTPQLSSYTLNTGATQSFDGWDTALNAGTVSIAGTLTHEINSAVSTNSVGEWEPNARVRIVCADFALASGGVIDISGKGFQGGAYTNGYGPGRGMATQHRGGGGGYGGTGSGAAGYGAKGGAPYGSAELPDMPGSGGGSTFGDVNSVGGNGGGLAQIIASGAANISGTIIANGLAGKMHCPGGGSGGGVYIRCATLTGNGTITADGGGGSVGGGGGRIAVDVTDTVAQSALTPGVQFSASVVMGGNGDTRGNPGTLYFSRRTFFPYTTLTGTYMLLIEGVSEIRLPELTVTGGEQWFINDLIIDGDLTIRNAGAFLVMSNATLSCGGNLTLENSGKLRVYGSPTNDAARAYGNIVSVGGQLTIDSGAILYPVSHPTNGASVCFDVGALNVAATGTINADSAGFVGGLGRGVSGFGPGGGMGLWASDRGGGGGYGGKGATHNTGATTKGGDVYGDARLPIYPGSGGGGKGGDTGGTGGGLIWIRAKRDVVVDGTLTANGTRGTMWPAGDGSGGGIFIDCRNFSGSGTLSADGGKISGTNGAHGGGGRVAVWQKVNDSYRAQFMAGNLRNAILTDAPAAFDGTITVDCGDVGYAGETAEPGTVVFMTSPPQETLLMIR